MKVVPFPFLFRTQPHNEFYSTLDRLRGENKLCPLTEEGIPGERDLEASYFALIFSQHGESIQPSRWGTEYSLLEKDLMVVEPKWQRKCRYAGHVALLTLALMAMYLIIFARAF